MRVGMQRMLYVSLARDVARAVCPYVRVFFSAIICECESTTAAPRLIGKGCEPE